MALHLDYSFLTPEILRANVLGGFLYAVQLTAVSAGGGIVLGTFIALMRLSGRKWLERFATVYVDGLRSIPLLMVILWFFLLIPTGFFAAIAGQYGVQHRPELSAVITFTVFEAAYFSEIMRAGIQSVPRGQVHAGYAVGMTYAQVMKLVVLPQAFRNMLPVLLTQTIVLFQDTSLVYSIGAYDLLKGLQTTGQTWNRPQEMLVLAAAIYFVLSFSLSMLVRKLQAKIQIIR
jgi:glutamate/aspartate transport system permease protein